MKYVFMAVIYISLGGMVMYLYIKPSIEVCEPELVMPAQMECVPEADGKVRCHPV